MSTTKTKKRLTMVDAKRFESTRGVSLAYRDGGKGTPLVMLSGWGYGSAMGEVAVGELRSKGFRVLTIDFPGTGLMGAVSSFVYIPRLALAVAELLRHLQVHEAVVVGHSFGSMVAQELAMTEDDLVGKLVLMSVLPGIGGVIPNLSTSMLFLNRLMVGDTGSLSYFYPPGYLAQLKATLGDVFDELEKPASHTALSGQVWAASRWTNIGRIGNIYQPTLIIHGAKDPLSPPENATLLARQLKQAQLHVLPAGYLPVLEKQEQVLKLVREFTK
jgi:pimeloyl-ACP methyl ester carboxylesterase